MSPRCGDQRTEGYRARYQGVTPGKERERQNARCRRAEVGVPTKEGGLKGQARGSETERSGQSVTVPEGRWRWLYDSHGAVTVFAPECNLMDCRDGVRRVAFTERHTIERHIIECRLSAPLQERYLRAT